jgi:GNAT superfamily N-acetyltransferase
MFFDPFPAYRSSDFIFKIARSPAELEGYWRLRRRTFCEEQRVFSGDDRDLIDEQALPIICATLIAGMFDEVVGAVRIDQRIRGLWHGGRLCVHPLYRGQSILSAAALLRNRQPLHRGFNSLGAGLIYKAVSTASALGCNRFLADVQARNERFFQRLHWTSLEKYDLYGQPHVRMEADLSHYPAAEQVA